MKLYRLVFRQAGTPKSCLKKTNGFTLIEMILVLILFSAACGIIAPDLFSRVQRNRMEDYSWQLGLLLRECYFSAVYSGKDLWVYVDESNEIGVFDKFPKGKPVESIHFKHISIPEWVEIKGLENGWCARADGFCEETNLTVRDIELGFSTTFALRPYDGEIIEKESNYEKKF
ncbi:MAG: type II secretion system protein [Candidatus Riflebacteria bacterium]|nr:type II secretion system protein [Candidatus Riflebacteria bacterium]